jgi:hypothetical protein
MKSLNSGKLFAIVNFIPRAGRGGFCGYFLDWGTDDGKEKGKTKPDDGRTATRGHANRDECGGCVARTVHGSDAEDVFGRGIPQRSGEADFVILHAAQYATLLSPYGSAPYEVFIQ